MMRRILWGYGKKVLIIHYADLLKFMCKQLFSWNGEKDERGRTLLQHVGTNIIRAKRPDYWVDYVASVLELFNDEWEYVLIPDCRFPNEINSMRDKGFDVTHVCIDRGDYDNGLTDEQKSHPSETALDNTKPDATILNVGNLVDLTKAVMDFIIPIYESLEEE